MDPEFQRERRSQIAKMGSDEELLHLSRRWVNRAQQVRYSYNFDWLGLPIIQYPQDVLALQEIVWSVKPNLIVETGVARGGSAIFYASMLELLAACGHGDGLVISIDIEIRPGNREAILEHPLSRRVELIEGSSVALDTVEMVRSKVDGESRVLICLDANHTHEHVLSELHSYAPLVSVGSYVIVFDTLIENLDEQAIGDRPWHRGNNPMTAVKEFLSQNASFELDQSLSNKLQISAAPSGFLKRIR